MQPDGIGYTKKDGLTVGGNHAPTQQATVSGSRGPLPKSPFVPATVGGHSNLVTAPDTSVAAEQ